MSRHSLVWGLLPRRLEGVWLPQRAQVMMRPTSLLKWETINLCPRRSPTSSCAASGLPGQRATLLGTERRVLAKQVTHVHWCFPQRHWCTSTSSAVGRTARLAPSCVGCLPRRRRRARAGPKGQLWRGSLVPPRAAPQRRRPEPKARGRRAGRSGHQTLEPNLALCPVWSGAVASLWIGEMLGQRPSASLAFARKRRSTVRCSDTSVTSASLG